MGVFGVTAAPVHVIKLGAIGKSSLGEKGQHYISQIFLGRQSHMITTEILSVDPFRIASSHSKCAIFLASSPSIICCTCPRGGASSSDCAGGLLEMGVGSRAL
mmetsp:Transcript_17607/g.27422  ORF Transcript_17607/g.27422 Transcript_17607/m.27422 type:complete len:103 (+) Transcript_17607:399-707(+)